MIATHAGDPLAAIVVDASVWIAAMMPTEPEHATSRRFVGTALAWRLHIVLHPLTRVEIGCTLARRRGEDAATRALAAFDALPLRTGTVPDHALLDAAMQIGMRARLRTLDAILVTSAIAEQATLVTWDRELLERAGAVTPAHWLDVHAT